MQNDPLDRAVEKLWLNGIVVVAAAGNYAVDGAESGVGFAPANDPFVITVGASDTNGTVTPTDDFAAPWSAWGPTQDGFRKPELAAPGRMLNGPVADGLDDVHEQSLAQGRRRLHVDVGHVVRGPIVSGAAATVLSRHPGLDAGSGQGRPDGVRRTSRPVTTRSGALGVGTLEHRRSDRRRRAAPTRTPGSTASSSPIRRQG